jgi:hypothetical protein
VVAQTVFNKKPENPYTDDPKPVLRIRTDYENSEIIGLVQKKILDQNMITPKKLQIRDYSDKNIENSSSS